MKSITSIISAVLGIISFVLFISIGLPLWGKVVCAILCLANIVSCFIADERFSEGKLAFSPILSWIIQLALSFVVLAIVS
jgi:hypothetical protein